MHVQKRIVSMSVISHWGGEEKDFSTLCTASAYASSRSLSDGRYEPFEPLALLMIPSSCAPIICKEAIKSVMVALTYVLVHAITTLRPEYLIENEPERFPRVAQSFLRHLC
jgi:hypothetical protein